MSSIGTGYDLSAAQFSPDGRVFQVEYAQKAVENSGEYASERSVFGKDMDKKSIRGRSGVVLGVERLVQSKLYEDDANKRIFHIDLHIGMAVAGLLADARQLVDIARQESAQYRSYYGSPIPCKVLADRVSMYMHAYTLYSFVRPFGCSILLASYDKTDGAELYSIEPSGVCNGCFGAAIGKAKQAAKTEIEKIKMKELDIDPLYVEVAKIIYTVHDEVKDKAFILDLSWVGETTDGRHEFVPLHLKSQAEEKAKASLAAAEESDEEM